MERTLGRALLAGVSYLLYFFLYLPIAVTILFSFNAARLLSFPLTGFTLHWYQELLQDGNLLRAARYSLSVTLPAVLVAMVLGTLAAFLFHRHRFPGQRLLQAVIILPYILPGIITGVSLALLFKFVSVPGSLATVIIGHVTFITPLVMLVVMDRLKRFDTNLENASLDLGATPWLTFWHITLPNIASAILGGALLALIVSFDEIIVTFFLIGNQATLPVRVWAMIRMGYSPEVNALYTLIIVASLALMALGARVLLRSSATTGSH